MPVDTCDHCGSDYAWNWSEAFDKFGFNDGDGQMMTEEVADVLRQAGYTVATTGWGLHNTVIDSITHRGRELIDFDNITFGYDEPRVYLPKSVVALLDRELPDGY